MSRSLTRVGALLCPALLLLPAACTPDGEGTARNGDVRSAEAASTPAERPSAASGRPDSLPEPPVAVEPEEGEAHFSGLRKLTFTGQNAEAYFSPDGERLIFQATRPGSPECDQIWTMGIDGSDLRMVSTGEGRTTCAYFFPAGDRILYSSTHLADPACPPPPDYSRGYVWALYDYDIFSARPDGSGLRRLTDRPGYDAEATFSPDGSRIVFTSARGGDLDIYTMAPDGSDVRRLTRQVGYDGGPFFSPDGTKIVYRAHHPESIEGVREFRALLEENLVRPSTMEIFVMDADGRNKTQLTDTGAANFAPYFHPDGRRIIFASNLHDPDSRNFDLYMIAVDGTGLERITTHPDFDGFPMFDAEGERLVFASNRHNRKEGDTNVFIADWVEGTDDGAGAGDDPARATEDTPRRTP